jgi:hypothetical protein
MRFVTSKAQESGSIGLFSWYQFIQGFGRIAGPFVLGFLIEIGLNAAWMAIVLFDAAVFLALIAGAAYCANKNKESRSA